MTTERRALPTLVTGGTGKQGGAVARALLSLGMEVRALVRDPSSDAALALKRAGVELVHGDLNDAATLRPACVGVGAVFSVLMPDMQDLMSDSEIVQARNLLDAAKSAGVPHFVHSSVSGSQQREDAPGWKEGRWNDSHMAHYWTSKAEIEDLVRGAGFDYWTIIRPTFFMENFIRPSFLFENWTGDRLMTIIKPDTVMPLVTVKDIGTAAAAAIADPERFNRVELELAGDAMSMKEIAAVLSEAMSLDLKVPNLTADEAIAQGMMPPLVVGQEWTNAMPAPAKPQFAHALGLSTTDFPAWAKETLTAARIPA